MPGTVLDIRPLFSLCSHRSNYLDFPPPGMSTRTKPWGSGPVLSAWPGTGQDASQTPADFRLPQRKRQHTEGCLPLLQSHRE